MLRRMCVVIAITAAASGCSSAPQSGTITGKVSVAGKPVKGGIITFKQATLDGVTVTTEIKADGTYEATGVPFGVLQISLVTNPPILPGDSGSVKARVGAMAAAQPGQELTAEQMRAAQSNIVIDAGPQVPAKYNDPFTSELTFTLDKPVDTHDLDVK